MQTSIYDIFKNNGVLAKGNPYYKERTGQIQAATKLSQALEIDDFVFILEGPCGFGKSLTYLVPTIKNLIDNDFGGRIVIATSNISLQEQLVSKDVPMVLEKLETLNKSTIPLEERLKPTELKGMNNFICLERLNDSEITSKFTALDTPQDTKEEFNKFEEYIKKTKQGDVNKFKINISREYRELFTCPNSDECSSTACSYNKVCFYNRQKEIAKASKIIITNYHMLFSSVLHGASTFDKTTRFVFDEVHEAEAILREFTAQNVSEGTFRYIKKQRDILEKKCMAIPFEDGIEIMKDIDISRIEEHAKIYFNEIFRRYKNKLELKPLIITKQSELPDQEDIVVNLNTVKNKLEKLAHICEAKGAESEEHKLKVIADRLVKTCNKALELLNNIDKLNKDPNNVTWLEQVTNKKGVKSILIGKKEIDVSKTFKEKFLTERKISSVLTSATISSNGNFEYLKNSLGVKDSNKKVYEYLGKTPFNLQQQELWFAPKRMVSAKNENHFDISMEIMLDLIESTDGGALILFTSNESLNRSKEFLRNKIGDKYNILAQHEMSKSVLLEKFKEDENSILIGSKSFFTGVDIQGQALRCVIIDKLPFNNISEPVSQRLNQEKGAFFKYFLPEMTILLRQAIGRGVRTISDHCVICVLDSRLYDAKYSKHIFNSFGYQVRGTRESKYVKYFMEINNG